MGTSRRWAMLADDVTGACDTGVQFAAVGLSTEVFLTAEGLPDTTPDLAVVATNTRNSSPADARARVTRDCELLKSRDFRLVYKKIDSTLKGPIGSELDATMRCFEITHSVITPAFPAAGRVLVDGWLRGCRGVDVEPVHLATRLREEGITHVQSLGLDAIRRDADALPHAFATGEGVIIVDAETESDLARIAAACMAQSDRPLPVGSGGLAIPLARHLATARSRETATEESPHGRAGNGPVVLFIGSTNPVTVTQVEELMATREVWEYRLGGPLTDARRALADCHDVLIEVPVHRVEDSKIHHDLTQLQTLFREQLVGGVVIFGGDTAVLVSRGLNASSIQLENEVLPGIPSGRFRGGTADGIAVVTKAGGFGDTHALCEVVEHLHRAPVTNME